MSSSRDRLTFFRQSGWMVMATVAGGIFMSAVHMVVNKPMKPPEYAVFFALLRVFLLMGFPAGGLQVVFAQQAAAAISEEESRRLSATTRSLLQATFLIWLLMAAAIFAWHKPILSLLKIANPTALWVTVILGLASLWAPIFKGLLQGRQDFAGLGWVLIVDGVGRFTAIVLIVHWGGQAAGAMTGALIGQIVSLALGFWLARRILTGPGAPFEWRGWLGRVIPLTLGVGVFLFMSNVDVIYVQTVTSKAESPFYSPAAMIGLALVSFTTPLAAVMFPKIVQGAALTQTTNALRHALVATALLGGVAALACTFLPELPLRIIYFRNRLYWASAPLVPWFAWCLLPLILANVLINSLLARARFQMVPWLVLVAVGYGVSLYSLKDKIQLFSPGDIKVAAFGERMAKHDDPVSGFLWERLPPTQRLALTQTNPATLRPAATWAQALNEVIKGPLIYDEERFAGVSLSEEVRKLVESRPQGKELLRLNRLLLQEAFPTGLAPPMDKLFRGFKLVIGTLGAFSSLLLLAAMWFTFAPGLRSAGERPPAS